MKNSVALLVVATVGHLFGYLFAIPDHIFNTSWPLHARFHVLQACFWIVGFDLVTLAVILGPFRRQESWSRWMLLASLVFVHCGYFFSITLIPAGRPRPTEIWPHISLGILLIMFATGLFTEWRDQNHNFSSRNNLQVK